MSLEPGDPGQQGLGRIASALPLLRTTSAWLLTAPPSFRTSPVERETSTAMPNESATQTQPPVRTVGRENRFDRFLPLAGVLAGLFLTAGLVLTYSIPSSETAFDETFSWWQDNRGQHQISGLLLAPLVALMLIFFGAGLKRSLQHDSHDSGYGSVAFGGAILGAGGFALIGMLEGAATNAAHEGHREAVYALSQLHSYDWLAFNASWAAVLLATGLGARRNQMLPTPLVWATIVIGASQLTPIGFFGSLLIPPWLIVVGLWLSRRRTLTPEPIGR